MSHRAEETVGFYGKNYLFEFRSGGKVTMHCILLLIHQSFTCNMICIAKKEFSKGRGIRKKGISYLYIYAEQTSQEFSFAVSFVAARISKAGL